MSSCRATRRQLVDLVRGTASDAVRLQVESHLEDCEDCRIERSRLGLLGALRELPGPALSAAGGRRVLARMLDAPVGRPSLPRRLGTNRHAGLVGAGVAVALATVFAFVLRGGGLVAPLTEPRQIEGAARGEVTFGGARVWYVEGTEMFADPPRRRLALTRGEVDVDVDAKSGLPGHFRVTTARFVVEVLGTHFVVTPESVRTLRGRVRVLDADNRELAVLVAGQTWTVPPARASPSHPEAGPAPVALAPPARPIAAAAAGVPRRPAVAQLLARGRSAMAEGDASGARAWIARARAEAPTEREAAALDLLEADAWLVTKQPDAAIAAYRRVARRWSGTSEAETAAFAIGQLLAEGDSPLAAETALTEYLAHYPHGRFAREAREQLAQLRPAQ